MKIEERFREPTSTEAAFMRRLLATHFRGNQEIAKQLEDCRVRIIDKDGSLALELSAEAKPAVVDKRIPVEGDGVDEDGVHIHFLLHVLDGFARELEIYKDDGSPIRRLPCAEDLEVIVLPA